MLQSKTQQKTHKRKHIAQKIHHQAKPMEVVATRDDVLRGHSRGLNRIVPQINYTEKPVSRRANESEISIFDADRYFNGGHHSSRASSNNGGVYAMSIPSIPRLSSVSDDGYGRKYRGRSSGATPTASSEASWNSQTGLLMHPRTLAPVSIRNLPGVADRTRRKTSASMKWFLRGNKCPCSGKKSVSVEESNSEVLAMKASPRIDQLNRKRSSGGGGGGGSGSGGPSVYTTAQSSPNVRSNLMPDESFRDFVARPQLNQHKLFSASTNPKLNDEHREKRLSSDCVAVRVKAFGDSSGTTSNGFTFPILCNSATSSKRTFNIVSGTGGSNGDAPRDSLEVFELQEDRLPRSFTTSPKSRIESYEDGMCSDASSDLFEIESFSTTTLSAVFARRDSLDEPASNFNMRRIQIGTAGVEGEEEDETVTPSEVSVDWSVTTAEGFDRARVSVSASEVGYDTLLQAARSVAGDGNGECRRRGNGGLLTSCRREKAVNVGPSPIKYRQPQRGGM